MINRLNRETNDIDSIGLSRLTAERAWREFETPETRYWTPSAVELETTTVTPPEVLTPVTEARWVSTNRVAQRSLAIIENLALLGGYHSK